MFKITHLYSNNSDSTVTVGSDKSSLLIKITLLNHIFTVKKGQIHIQVSQNISFDQLCWYINPSRLFCTFSATSCMPYRHHSVSRQSHSRSCAISRWIIYVGGYCRFVFGFPSKSISHAGKSSLDMKISLTLSSIDATTPFFVNFTMAVAFQMGVRNIISLASLLTCESTHKYLLFNIWYYKFWMPIDAFE